MNGPLRGYFLTVAAGEEAVGRVSLNGIPVRFVARTMLPGTTVDPVNHFLVPGHNTFSVLVSEVPGATMFTTDIRLDHHVVLVEYKTPWYGDRDPPPPYRYEVGFTVDDASPPPYRAATPAEFGPEGTPGQRRVVERLHAALRRGDAGAFVDEIAGKLAVLRQTYGPLPDLADAYHRADYGEAMRLGSEAAPLPDDLVYESCAGGRVACVHRRDGEWALRAVLGRSTPFRTNVYLLHGAGDDWSLIW